MTVFVYLSFFSLLAVLIISLFYNFRSTREGHLYIKISDELEGQIEKIIKSRINKLLEETEKKIDTIIDNTVSAYRTNISDFSKELKKEYSDLGNIRNEIEKEIIEDVKKKTDSILEEMSKEVTKQINSTSSFLSRELQSKTKQLEKEIENYKRERIKEIDKKVYQVIERTSKEIFGRIIDISTHERLVLEALEKAKKENIL